MKKKNVQKTKLVKATDKRQSVDINIPTAPKEWKAVKSVKLNKMQKAELENVKEFKGFQIWFAPFKTPLKPFRVDPKHSRFVVEVVTWGKKYLVRANNKRVLNIIELR